MCRVGIKRSHVDLKRSRVDLKHSRVNLKHSHVDLKHRMLQISERNHADERSDFLSIGLCLKPTWPCKILISDI